MLEGDLFRFHLPNGWVDVSLPGGISVEGGRDGAGDSNRISVQSIPADEFKDVRDFAPSAMKTFRRFVDKPRRLPFTQWAGKPSYHFAGSGSAVAGYAEEFGAMWEDHIVVVWFDFDTKDQPEEWTPAARQAVIASVEASWEWK